MKDDMGVEWFYLTVSCEHGNEISKFGECLMS
jgi:hypothetical protein